MSPFLKIMPYLRLALGFRLNAVRQNFRYCDKNILLRLKNLREVFESRVMSSF